MAKKPKGWYKELVLRPTVDVEGYESYEKICAHAADGYYCADEQKLLGGLATNPKESMYISLYVLFKVGQAKCPAYWVGKDLLEALQQSILTVEIDSLNWTMKTGLFMLPKSVILSPEQHSVDAIYWHYDTESDILYWTATDGSSLFCRKIKVKTDLIKLTYIDVDVQDLDPQVVTGFNEYLQAIFLRLILIMECRPELVETESLRQKVTVNQGFGKNQATVLYQPLWLGQSYRLKREQAQASDGSSDKGTKRVHWRRGFLGNQPYGEGRQQRKIVWIEPVLVMGGE